MLSSELHILVIPAWFPSEANPWAGIFIAQQCVALAELDRVQVGLLYRASHEVPEHMLDYLKQSGVHTMILTGVYIPKIVPFLIDLWCKAYQKAYCRYVNRFGMPDMIHAHSYVAGIAAESIFRRYGVPYVLTEHSTSLLRHEVRKVYIQRVHRAFDRAKHLFAVGKALRRKLLQWTESPISILPNPIDPQIFRYDAYVDKRAEFTIMTVGALIPRKRVGLLLNAFTEFRNEEVNLICVGSGIRYHSLIEKARRLQIAKAIEWHAQMPPEQIAATMQKTHMFVSVSETETSGVAVAEALMCGLPVVCTESGGPEEFVSEAQGIVLPPMADHGSIAKAIRNVMENYTSYDPVDISNIAANLFSKDKVIAKLVSKYREILRALV